jgi:hypothetical protein
MLPVRAYRQIPRTGSVLGIEPDAVLGSPEELPDWYRNAGFDQ